MPGYVPAPIADSDVFRVSFFQTLNLQRLLTVLHFRFSTALITDYLDAMNNLATALANSFVGAGTFSGWGTLVTADLTFDFLRVQRVADSREVYIERLISTTGTLTAPSAPPNVALTLNKRTLKPGRHGRGDLHMGGCAQASLSQGIWSPLLVGNATSIWSGILTNPFVDSVTGNEIRFGVYDPELTMGGIQDIINVVGFNQVRTMHRRTVGLGE